MKIACLRIMNALLALVYAPCKLLPLRDKKALFLSRQSSTLSMDYRMLEEELLARDSGLQLVFICNRIEPGLASKLSYMRDTLRSLYHLATSRVCVLDSYWPAVSVLKHRPELTVIQIWHAVGKIKQSGLQTVGKPGGRDANVARVMHMHENYDYIVAGAPAWNRCYCECFGCRESQLLNFGLPRMDYLASGMASVAAKIRERYPQLAGKKVVVYAPTFRRTVNKDHADFIEAFRAEDCELVIKAHPNQEIDAPGVLRCPEFTGMDMLSVADLVITDYSAIAVEAAVAGVRTLYYLYDYDNYKEKAGLNLDIPHEIPECTFFDVPSLMQGVHKALSGDYPEEAFRRYREKFTIADAGHSTADIAAFVLSCLNPAEGASSALVEGGEGR
jgi:CDP-glycerol glycerophosphotransferase (TagB/SpsB family)